MGDQGSVCDANTGTSDRYTRTGRRTYVGRGNRDTDRRTCTRQTTPAAKPPAEALELKMGRTIHRTGTRNVRANHRAEARTVAVGCARWGCTRPRPQWPKQSTPGGAKTSSSACASSSTRDCSTRARTKNESHWSKRGRESRTPSGTPRSAAASNTPASRTGASHQPGPRRRSDSGRGRTYCCGSGRTPFSATCRHHSHDEESPSTVGTWTSEQATRRGDRASETPTSGGRGRRRQHGTKDAVTRMERKPRPRAPARKSRPRQSGQAGRSASPSKRGTDHRERSRCADGTPATAESSVSAAQRPDS